MVDFRKWLFASAVAVLLVASLPSAQAEVFVDANTFSGVAKARAPIIHVLTTRQDQFHSCTYVLRALLCCSS